MAHPYLSEELTARQVVDGVRYGIELYKNSAQVSEIRHPFRSGWDYFTHIKSIVDYAPEAYAVYADGTLSFYYDGQIATRQGRAYRLNEGEHFPGWSDTFGGGPTGSSDPEDHSKDITKVVFSPSFRDARPTSTFGWFSDCVNRWQ